MRERVIHTHLLPRIEALRDTLAHLPVKIRSASVLVIMEGDDARLQALLARGERVLDVRIMILRTLDGLRHRMMGFYWALKHYMN